MNICIRSLSSTLACCFGNAFCTFCCSTCPSCKGSTSTRFAYGLFVLLGIIVSSLMLIPDIQTILYHIPHFCVTENQTESLFNCTDMVGYVAVYRISFGYVLFFLLLCLLMINVKSSNDFRAKIQNGFWAFKFLVLVALIVGSFYIPADRDKEHDHPNFDNFLMYFGSVGGALFILAQLVLAIGLLHSWNEAWVDQVELGSKKHGYGLLFFTFLFYVITIICIICLYQFYGHASCTLNLILITINLCFCLLLSIVSILPRIRAYNSSCGLLQSSFVSFYVMIYTWSALRNHPDSSCSMSETINLGVYYIIFSLVVYLLVLFYLIIGSSRNSRLRKLFLPTVYDFDLLDDALLVNSESTDKWILGNEDDIHQRVYDDEKGSVAYNYSLFHLMLIIAVLYIMMTLTNWREPNESFLKNDLYSAFWFKMVSTWICVGLYIWSCIAPAVFPDRDFS